jgi:hypothetical protein
LKKLNIHNETFISLNVSNLPLWTIPFSTATLFLESSALNYSSPKARRLLKNLLLKHSKIRNFYSECSKFFNPSSL